MIPLPPMRDESELRKRAIVLYDYNPTTGVFTRRADGLPVRRKSSKGYLQVGLFGMEYYAHRVAYLIMEGRWPKQIDHLNRVRDDNRWDNLQEADSFINAANHRLRITNKTGITGVEMAKDGRWRAALVRNGKGKRRGWFRTFEEAVEARNGLLLEYARGEW